MKKTTLIYLLLILLTACSKESEPQQPASYSFFVAGHTYGKPGRDNIGLHPPFKEKFGYIQSRKEIKFGVLTGDIVPAPSPEDWDEVDADIDSLGLPVYFAVGNHDMRDRELFESRYGPTYFSFYFNTDLFIVLDPNIDHWNISGEQLDFLKTTVSNNSESVDNIFVLFHQVLWRTNDNIYKDVKLNSYEDRDGSINFWTEVEPIFSQLENPVFMFAGDVGAGSWSSDFMYDKYDNISLVASGMGEGDGDNFVIINIHSDKSVTYDLVCMSDSTLNCFGDLTDYQLTPAND
ncbi:metallophosphoesterase [uncultured Draconibacterium sp.]|uniref:metallophosphoesterase family protein n=1 Tax=uncultured Draconibacterium sp. TaxID=1573823 RepID=UPI0029C67A4D|nr:metallophosphoesterase [uncultured Draconibacterium sp.]